eukprot:SAG22_NODE_3992_length_1434_cov_1.704120_1_plen_152_part_10
MLVIILYNRGITAASGQPPPPRRRAPASPSHPRRWPPLHVVGCWPDDGDHIEDQLARGPFDPVARGFGSLSCSYAQKVERHCEPGQRQRPARRPEPNAIQPDRDRRPRPRLARRPEGAGRHAEHRSTAAVQVDRAAVALISAAADGQAVGEP